MFGLEGSSRERFFSELKTPAAGAKTALINPPRGNPFERRFRSLSAGLAPVIAPNGTLIMYSAALGAVVGDGSGAHSLFVSELLKESRAPELTAEEALNRVRVAITRASHNEQVPWISSSL